MKVHSIAPYTTINRDNEKVPSFKAMKPSMFSGTDYACVRKFKAPVEQFNAIADLYKWAGGRVSKLISGNFDGRQECTSIQRKSMLAEWSKYLTTGNDAITPAMALIVLSSIVKELKPNNDNIPPVLDKLVLADSIAALEGMLSKNKDSLFDFSKIYRSNINNAYINSAAGDAGRTRWLVIPSKKRDKVNFNKNVERLKLFSAPVWCTKSFNAEPYLEDGDFHIYLDSGKPKLGLRFDDGVLVEIQGEKNNNIISVKMFDVLSSYMEGKNFNLSSNVAEKIKSAMIKREQANRICKEIGIDAVNNNDAFRILDYLGFDPKPDEYGCLSISTYCCLNFPNGMTMNDLSIDENKLFQKISEIRGNALFSGTEVTNLGNLKRISGNVDCENSCVMTLGNLESIDGYANFANSLVTSSGQLKKIGKWVDFENSILEDLGLIEYIGGNAYFNNSRIKTLGMLKCIGGYADFSDSQIISTGMLESVCKGYKYANSPLSSDDFKNIKTRN